MSKRAIVINETTRTIYKASDVDIDYNIDYDYDGLFSVVTGTATKGGTVTVNNSVKILFDNETPIVEKRRSGRYVVKVVEAEN